MLRAAMRSRSIACAMTFIGACLFASVARPAVAQVRTPPPVVERLEPTSGPPGTTVQVIGRFFRSDQTVLLGDVELPTTARLPNRVTVTIPAGATSGHVTIRLADGTTVAGPELRVLAAPSPPVIASLVPAHAPPGAEVRIVGDHFSARLTENNVTIGGLPVVVRTATPTELAVIVPTGAATGPFTVTVTGAGSASSASFTVDVGVAITSFEPAVASPGARVTLHGTGFAARASGERVFVNGTTARIASTSATEIAIDVPAHATTGTLLVDVRGSGQAYSSAPLTILAAPTVASIEPTSGVIGATVHVRGTGFGTDIRQVAVSVHGVALTVRNVTDTEITAEIASGSSSDHLSVVIHGLPAVLSHETFSVLVPVAVSGFSPEQGGPGTDVTITGTGFSTTTADDRVTITGMPCTVVSATPTELHVRMPTASSGPLIVEVRNAGTARTSRPFVMTTPPTIASFEPTSGTVGTIIHVHGTNFGEVPSLVEVTFGGRAGSIQSMTATQIDVLVPQGATTGRIGVSVRLQGTSTSSTDFRVLGNLSVSAVDPTSAYPGQTVIVRGSGLNADGLSVMFTGAHAAATVTARTTSEMRVVVPADAQTGPLTVRSDDGRTSATTFTLAATPSGVGVTEVVPACTHTGCAVVVRGYGFATRAAGQTVTIGGQRARVRRAGTYELELQIPARVPLGPAAIHIDVRGTGAIDGPPIAVTAE